MSTGGQPESRTLFSPSSLFPSEGKPDLTSAEQAMARMPSDAVLRDPNRHRRKSTPQKVAHNDGLNDDGDSPMRDDSSTPVTSNQRREFTAIPDSVSSAVPIVSTSQRQLDPG